METYAFWRPPVRTLTFEDFTNMQKQQGVWTEHQNSIKGASKKIKISLSYITTIRILPK